MAVSAVDGIEICAPVTHDTTKEVISKDGSVHTTENNQTGAVTTAQSTAPASTGSSGKGELIFNFMGLVWGTNDTNPDHQQWMQEATK